MFCMPLDVFFSQISDAYIVGSIGSTVLVLFIQVPASISAVRPDLAGSLTRVEDAVDRSTRH